LGAAVNWTLPMLTRPLTSTVAWPVFVKVAIPSGTVPPLQFSGSIHSVGSPALLPTQVASTAWAETTPSAVVPSNTASEYRPAECSFRRIHAIGCFEPAIAFFSLLEKAQETGTQSPFSPLSHSVTDGCNARRPLLPRANRELFSFLQAVADGQHLAWKVP
jgi:hypothetical protein